MRRLSARTASFAVCIVFGLQSCGTTDPSSSDRSLIWFTCSNAQGTGDICNIRPDGSGFRRLGPGFDPTVSPDRSTVAFICAQDHGGVVGAVCLMDSDGSNQRKIIDSIPSWYRPDWSSTDRLTFRRQGEIWTANPDGSGYEQLTQTGGIATDPDWSPDGSQIVFANDINADDAGALWLMNADGSNLRMLLDLAGSEYHPAWSPDGSRILFTLSRRHPTYAYPTLDIYVYEVSSGTARPLTTYGTVFGATWSPDGNQIVFSGRIDEAGHGQLFIMNSDGTGAHNLTNASSRATWVTLP